MSPAIFEKVFKVIWYICYRVIKRHLLEIIFSLHKSTSFIRYIALIISNKRCHNKDYEGSDERIKIDD